MKTTLEPMFAAFLLGGWEILLILLSLLIMLAVVVGIIILVIILTKNRKPAPLPPPMPEPPVKSPTVPPTEIIPVKCPQCGTTLPSGALAGLCPACLLKMGAAADTVTNAKQSAFNPPTVAELAPLFPQLEILELIGKGGMGAVYKARQKQLDRVVALKILPPGIGDDPAFAERFTREARALAKLNHPGIVTLYEFGAASGYQPSTRNSQLFYFLMEFVDGVNLRQLLHAGRISAREALAIVPQICDALQFAHDQGIVHRDIKPENILLDRRGRVKVADFGLAKIVVGQASRLSSAVSESSAQRDRRDSRPTTEDFTDAGKIMGTPQYMSPEQIAAPGEVDHRADIYALGVVFYQMLTGELPGKKLEPPSKKVHIDVRLDEIVLRALEKKPELRYQQVSEMKTGMETIVAMSPSSSRREEAQTESGKPSESLVTSATTNQRSRFSRTAIVGACWASFASIIWFLFHQIQVGEITTGLKIIGSILMLFGFTAPFGTTILGWLAVSQIRRSAGKLYGLWLAVFDGLLFPILMLDGLIAGVAIFVAHSFSRNRAYSSVGRPVYIWADSWWILLLTIFVILVLNLFIILLVWRVVNKPITPPVQKPDRFWRWFAVAVFAFISIPVVLAIVGSLAAIAIPNFVKARAQAQANAQRAAKLAALNDYAISLTNFYIGRTYFPKGDSIEITSVERNEKQMTVKGNYRLVSADSAILALNVTSTNPSDSLEDPQQSVNISQGRGDFELTHLHLMPGLPHVAMYADGHSFATLYFGTKAEALEESRAHWITNELSAAAETWSPTNAPGEKIDLQKILSDVKDLMDQGHYEDALQRQLWYFNHALEYDQGQTGVRLSFALSQWLELGRRYPKAKAALIEIRDQDTRKLAAGQGNSGLFADVSNINRELQDADATFAFFKTIREKDPQLARQCYFWAEDLLVSKGEYQWCYDYMGDPQFRFETIHSQYEMQLANQKRMADTQQRTKQMIAEMNQKNGRTNPPAFTPPDTSAMLKKFAEDRFVGQTRQLIEILVATGHKPLAKTIRDEAITVLNDERLQSAVSDAERKIGGRVESATPVLSFGPVIERTLTINGNKCDFLVLSSGKILSHSYVEGELRQKTPPTALVEWIRENNVDIGFCASSNKFYSPLGILAFDMGTYAFPSNIVPTERIPRFGSVAEWQAYDAHHDVPAEHPLIGSLVGVTNIWNDLTADLLQGPPDGVPVFFLKEKLFAKWYPCTNLIPPIAFSTREGVEGLLQITGFTDNPRGVKIRYKLVQNAMDNKTTRANDEVARLKLQAADQELAAIKQKVAVGLAPPVDYDRAKIIHDITVAELKGDAVEVVRLKLQLAELNLKVAGQLKAVGKATQSEYDAAKLARDMAAASPLLQH